MSRVERAAVPVRAVSALLLLLLAITGAAALNTPVGAQPPPETPAPETTAPAVPVPSTLPAPGPPSLTSEGVKVTRNVVTSQLPTSDGAAPMVLTADIYQPPDTTPAPTGGRPAMVLVHGGSWFQGEPANLDRLGVLLAQQGWVGFSVGYRLAAPDKPSYPDAVGDVQRGIRWVGANARAFGAEPSRIGVIGASAGGHLAALVATLGTDPILSGPLSSPFGTVAVPDPNPPVQVKVVATLSAPFVLNELVPNQGRAPFACGSSDYCQKFWTIPIIKNLVGCELKDCKQVYDDASPVNRVNDRTVPLWMANADDEIVPMGQMQLMGDALRASRIEHDVFVVQGHAHADEYTDRSWNVMVPYIADRLGVPRPQPVAFPVKGDGPGGGFTLVLGLVGILTLLATAGMALLSQRNDGSGGRPSRPKPVPTGPGSTTASGASAGDRDRADAPSARARTGP